MKNPWNITMVMTFDPIIKQKIYEIYKNKPNNRILVQIDEKSKNEIRKYLQEKYNEGYGFKILAREIGISYTQCRRLLIDILNIQTRKGLNVSTEKTKQFRSERVRGEKNPWLDWPNKTPELHLKNSKGIQGYYEKKTGLYIWLRSTWEYIYAKWLDRNNINWSYETRCYKLSNGENYRPDFNILDKKGRLKQIVEIKGYFKNRVYKVDLFKKDYPNIDIIIIDDITNYCCDYLKELQEWKQLRLKKSELNK